jgi:hypothetical protein
MNVEQTMQFILDQQAQMAAHMVDVDNHLKEIDARLAESARYQARTDKQLAILALMVKAGMKRLVNQGKKLDTHGEKLDRHEAKLNRIDRKLDRLIDGLLGKGRNGSRR